ncbi:hypothetical protein VP395_01530 [Mariniflexile soesokkakense]|uniref:Arginyl-tRNA synthetase n=1 Tax=Mariniflexile soesokkakense TaxID=1343160 RepID=A0ABV0A8V5_9FLAO
MVLDTTYTKKEHNNLINDVVGKPFSFLKSIKMKGIGSKRMIIDDASLNMKKYLNLVSDANLELRPTGIIIRINKGLNNFTWVMPHYQLVVYKTNGISIYAQGRFIHFKNNATFNENKHFFENMMNEKVKFESKYKFSQT